MAWKSIGWAEWCVWVQGKSVVQFEDGDGETVIDFLDGTRALVESEYDHGWSDLTPGDGIQPPSVSIWEE